MQGTGQTGASPPNQLKVIAMTKMESAFSSAIFSDEDDGQKIIRQHMALFLQNLVEQTPQNSKLAYQICHYVESNFLELPDLSNVFPAARIQQKKAQEKSNTQAAKLRRELADNNKELKKLNRQMKTVPGEAAEILRQEIDGYEEEISEIEDKLEKIGGKKDYKPVYPLTPEGVKVKDTDWKILKTWLVNKTKEPISADDDDLFNNLRLLSDHLGFSEPEKRLLTLLVCIHEESLLGAFVDNIGSRKQKNTYDLIGKMTGLSRQDISKMLQPDSPICAKGLVLPATLEDDYDSSSDSSIPLIAEDVLNILRESDMTMDMLSKRLIGEPVTTELDWDRDFSHLGERGDQLISMLQAAKEKSGHVKGLNFLLYGLPDTGKTQAAIAAAKKVGLTLYMVGENNEYGGEPDRRDRIRSALLAQALLADKKDAAILFDEMEDLLPGAGGGLFDGPPSDKLAGSSKVFLNRLLEKNTAVTFWTANDPEKFHPAVRRRMPFSIQFDIPPVKVRERLWGSISARHNFALSAENCRKFAQDYIAPPGMINTAISNAALAGGVKSIPLSLSASAQLVFGNRDAIVVRDTVPSNYDLRLLVAKLEDNDLNLEELGNHIKASGNSEFTMLLYGPPGTGKSAYAAYLAKDIGLESLIVKASDILGKYVGENEKNIANIFRKAREENLFLIIDEGDTFLRRRDQAAQNWEVSTVNEMLTQIENHKGPIAMTTNLFGDIDPAAKRRFLFKIKCDYMKDEQAQLAFKTFFDMEPPASLTNGTKFTPADFALIKKQIKVMAPDTTSERIVQLLKIEAATRLEKPTNYDGKTGFGFSTPGTITQPRPN